MVQPVINAFSSALSAVFSFIPRLVGFLVILLVGWLVGIGVAKAITLLLRKVGFDRLSDRIGLTRLEQRMGMRMDTASILGRIVFWFVFLIFLVPATDALGLPTVSNTLNAIVGYLPNVFVAIVILVLGSLIAVVVSDLIRGASRAANYGSPKLFAAIARWSIIGFSMLIALEQLDIAPALLNVLFTAVVGGLALAFALAFGLGGREPAQRLLSRGEGTIMGNRPYDPNQIVQQARTDLGHSERMGETYAQPGSGQTGYGTQQSYETQPNVPGKQQTVPPAPPQGYNVDQTPRRPRT